MATTVTAGAGAAGEERGPGRGAAPALLASLLEDPLGWGLAPVVTAAVEDWQRWTGRSVPSVRTAERALVAGLERETDLSPAQVRELVARIGLRGPTLERALGASAAALVRQLRPWFPVWRGFAIWVAEWARARGYRAIAFLCRDALPFFVLTRELAEVSGVHLSLVHVCRGTSEPSAVAAHFERVIPSACEVAFVDSGCYGSLLPTLVRASRQRGCDEPAVLFFFSRNPLVFGYMNYIAAAAELRKPRGRGVGSRLDFAIYAGDVLEAVPKAYRVRALGDDGEPVLVAGDLVSYVLARVLLWSLRGYAAESAGQVEGDRAVAAAERLEALYAGEAGPASLLLDEPAPKSTPPGLAVSPCYRAGFPPQDEFFGTVAG